MQDVLIIATIMAVPITAILSATFLKYKKLELQQSQNRSADKQLIERLLQNTETLVKANTELQKRIENLETIITLGDISLPAAKHPIANSNNDE
ncbi:MAG: hypothetical protein RMJ87_05700 [Cytophagales bacterium]|nr:hypothetical protein [Bernardetiaceae bacterium]MDW8204502.1 hypothetical protein [Cytophagales bacterium]